MDPDPAVASVVLRLFILGPAFAVLLHQRGLCVLHASGVVLQQGAVGFLGGPGAGKSTVAGALYGQGRHGIVADDVLAVDCGQMEPRTNPGFPWLKLWPDSVEALGQSAATLPRVHPSLTKCNRSATAAFPRRSLRLKRLYVLEAGDAPAIEFLEPQQAFVEIVRHSYAASVVHATATGASHFQQSSWLVSLGLVRRLRVAQSFSQLDQLVSLIEHDAERVSH